MSTTAATRFLSATLLGLLVAPGFLATQEAADKEETGYFEEIAVDPPHALIAESAK